MKEIWQAVPLEAAHLKAAAELEALCFSSPWSEKSLELLLGESAVGFAVIADGRLAAYGGMLTVLDEGQVTNVAVHPDFRRRGCGEAIVDAFLREAEKRGLVQISLEVRVSNGPAIGLYEKKGFYQAGVRKRFYQNPSEDAFVMLYTRVS